MQHTIDSDMRRATWFQKERDISFSIIAMRHNFCAARARMMRTKDFHLIIYIDMLLSPLFLFIESRDFYARFGRLCKTVCFFICWMMMVLWLPHTEKLRPTLSRRLFAKRLKKFHFRGRKVQENKICHEQSSKGKFAFPSKSLDDLLPWVGETVPLSEKECRRAMFQFVAAMFFFLLLQVLFFCSHNFSCWF